MSTTTVARRGSHAVDQSERAWWLRTLLVLQSPRAVFSALRDDSTEAEEARQEPVLLLVLLAGIAGVLAGPTTGTLLDDFGIDVVSAVVIVFLSGVVYAVFGYWIVGGALYLGSRWLGSLGSYRRSRHLLAFASAPLALSLVAVAPVRFAAYGSDVFRSGGSDAGAGGDVFTGIAVAFAAWALVLLVIGVRTVHGWSWGRALAACAASAAVLGVVLAVWAALGGRFGHVSG